MDFLWIFVAFIFGLGVRMINLPPMIGYLLAGFVLHYAGVEPDEQLETLANLGITLMLFTIGLKLNVKDLFKPEILGGALTHMGIWTLVVSATLLAGGAVVGSHFAGLDWHSAALLGFALSFSSTVCVVKLLEENGEMKTRHGKVAIGVLVIQDIAAVIFLVFATGKTPSIWAVCLLGLVFLHPWLSRILEKSGHGELLPLTGFFLALGGYELFSLVHIKGDLGALIIGMLLSSHNKASELSKSLLSFKDIFLIGFFLNIGFAALPDLPMIATALFICLLLPLKFILFFFLFTGFRLRGRTAFLSSLAMNNYSEFGLIVALLSVNNGWLSNEWLVIMALAVSFSFIYTNLWYSKAHHFYSGHKQWYRRFESDKLLKEDVLEHPQGAEILLIGLGRVGKGAYMALHSEVGDKVWGMDADSNRINNLKQEGMHVFCGDAENADMWENLNISTVRLVLIAVPSIEDCINVTEQLLIAGYTGKIAAIARYEDDRRTMLEAGINNVFNFYTEAGSGFAEESLAMLKQEEHITPFWDETIANQKV
ncbi:MAG: cation:proton antiporter [Candidatus Pelagadaptatus aseana]|uniref:cation:proton antiporter domain-containing protein n=1 Tax=Candidatus Pelagadaptatus aseana TaxID=3120508 RepID=UPI0039B181E5